MGRKEGSKDPGDLEDQFDSIVDDIQKAIQEREAEMYSETTLSEAMSPANMGKIDDPDATGGVKGVCGDTMVYDVRVEEGMITDIKFRTDGCGSTVASGSMLTKMVRGKMVEEALEIDSMELEERLGGLPDENKHCAVLAVNALHRALEELD